MVDKSEIPGYYDRFDPADNFEEHLFIAGRILQSAEMNEIQTSQNYKIKQIGDAFFKDGDIIRDARLILSEPSGGEVEVTCESGAIWLRGAVRGVPPATLTVPDTGTIPVGIFLVESIVTKQEDPSLADPATEMPTYGEPGADRLKVEPVWGTADSDIEGEFYPIYTIEDGQLTAKEAPPAFDSISQAIAKYDRDSSGSNYVVEGMRVTQLDDLGTGEQVYSVQEGRARVNGYGLDLATSRRIVYDAQPQLRFIDSEPKTSTASGSQRVNVNRTPISSIQQVRIQAQKVVTVNHGTFAGAIDPLPDTSVVLIVAVNQGGTWNGTSFTGGTTYTATTDYLLTADQVDWTPAGAEPAPGSSYSVVYQYITSVTPTDIDDTGFTITGAVVGTLILTNYYAKLPRIDRLCLTENGQFVWIEGVSTDYDPIRPNVPNSVIALAQVYQTWTDSRRVVNDGVRVVPMYEIEAMNDRMDQIIDLVAQQKLVSDINVREASAKKGLFVDPFLDDAQRDAGITQDAASFDGILTLPIDGDAINPTADVTSPQSCAFTLTPILSQELRTGFMKINPYMSFGILPGQATLTPSIDRWTEVVTQWSSPVTRTFFQNVTGAAQTLTSRTVQQINTVSRNIETLRPITIRFNLKGFGPGETLQTVTFDGLTVVPDNP